MFIEIKKQYIEDNNWVYLDIEPLNGKENLNEFLKFYTDLLVEVKERFLKVR